MMFIKSKKLRLNDLFLLVCLFLSISLTVYCEDVDDDDDDDDDEVEVKQAKKENYGFMDANNPSQRRMYAETIYINLFTKFREQQTAAVKQVTKFGSYEQRYKLVDIMLKQLFDVMRHAKDNVTEWKIKPEDPFPENQTQKFTLTKIFENTALFGELVLAMPDIVHEFYDKRLSYQMFMKWAFNFCNQSRIFEGSTYMQLTLMAQEVGIIPKDKRLFDPLVDMTHKKELLKKYSEKQKRMEDKKAGILVDKKKKIKKGPRLSSHVEL